MSDIVPNAKSDVSAKEAFIEELLRRGYDEAKITGSPADITARRASGIYYFEIKYTSQKLHYFGAATLTEWDAALTHADRYWFVVATKRDGLWIFHEYSPDEFMEFSYIPPFKIFFNVAVGAEKAVVARRGTKRVQLTREHVVEMVALYKKFKPN